MKICWLYKQLKMQKGFADYLKTPKSDAAGNQSRERLQEVGQFICASRILILPTRIPHTDQTHCFPLSILQLGKIHQKKSPTPFRYSTQLSSCLSAAHRTTASSPEKWDNCHCITQPSPLPSRHTASQGFSPKKKLDY